MATKKAVSASTKRKAATTVQSAKITAAKATSTAKETTSLSTASTKNTLVGYVQQSIRSVTLWRSLAAEFIGTFLLATVFVAGQGQPIFVLFAVAGIVLLVGGISGSHINPAITVGAWVTRRIGWLRAATYVLVQFLGAALAFVVLSSFLTGADTASSQAQAFGQSAPALFAAQPINTLVGKEWYLFFAELLGTGIIAFAVANATREIQDRIAGAFTIGFGVFIALMVAVSTASYVGGTAIINPAVATTLAAYDWDTLWSFGIYLFAPVIGAILGFLGYDVLRGRNTITK